MPVAEQELSVMYWNTWSDNQVGSAHQYNALAASLEAHVETQSPDVVGLNEVVADRGNMRAPRLLGLLEKLGYAGAFVPNYTERQYAKPASVGNIIATRKSIRSINHLLLAVDAKATKRNDSNHSYYLSMARIALQHDQFVDVGTTHIQYLLRPVLHRDITRGLQRAAATTGEHPTIIGGDFNKYRFMPRPMRRNFDHATGDRRTPTWRHNGNSRLLRANFDRLLWQDAQLKTFDVLEGAPSDHSPILGTFRIPNKGGSRPEGVL